MKDFHEREAASIQKLFVMWASYSIGPAVMMGIIYLMSPVDGLLGHPWNALFMTGATWLMLNIPNYLIAGIRGAALWMATYGRV